MLYQATESVVEVEGIYAYKKYLPAYYHFNDLHGRVIEAKLLERLNKKSKCFPLLLGILGDGIILLNHGISVGNLHTFESEIMKQINIPEFIEWLEVLRSELKKHGIKHHDIHPGNICFNGKTFVLIDFCWANAETFADCLNPTFGKDDDAAIDKMIKELKAWGKS